jgi:glycerophosphoryl diester phosphodiesterase
MIKVLGHRGVRQRKGVDENSLRAFEIALQESDGLETDVVVSCDQTPFLCHELQLITIPHLYSRSTSALKRHLNKASAKTAGKRRLDQMDAAEVDRLCLKNGACLPRLSALFALVAKYPGKTLNIELKGYGAVEPVLAEIRKAVAEGKITKDQIILSSFDHLAVAKARALDPEIKCGLIFSRNDLRDRRIYPWLENQPNAYAALNEATLAGKTAQDVQPDYFVMTGGVLSAKGVRQIRAHFPKARIIVWSTKKPEKDKVLAKKLANPDIGPHIDTIISDFPDKMIKMLKKKGLRP